MPAHRIRTCVGCRKSADKSVFVRVCRTAEGTIVVDDTGKLPGRGAYICPGTECFKKALKGNRLSRALRGRVDEPLLSHLQSIVVGRTNGVCISVE